MVSAAVVLDANAEETWRVRVAAAQCVAWPAASESLARSLGARPAPALGQIAAMTRTREISPP